MLLSIVCHGNIARSQVLHHCLDKAVKEKGLRVAVYSCGTTSEDSYSGVEGLLADVQQELHSRGFDGQVKRDWWTKHSEKRLLESDIVLAADKDRRHDILMRLAGRIDPGRVHLFYEFIGEGERDFVDTYDQTRGAQDPDRFLSCFDELERIAGKITSRLMDIAERGVEVRNEEKHWLCFSRVC